ncbi:MAG TPA: ATP-binding protein [Thermoanaerobaculia bacterium]|nr:ATP-binding protein [Thermoanaerobaculia bacterium]
MHGSRSRAAGAPLRPFHGSVRKGGLGVGLSSVRHIVELHGGTVSAFSAGRSRGATFTVRLPLLRV